MEACVSLDLILILPLEEAIALQPEEPGRHDDNGERDSNGPVKPELGGDDYVRVRRREEERRHAENGLHL